MPATVEWANKLWYVYTLEYYAAVRMCEVQLHAKISVILTNIMSETNITKKSDVKVYPVRLCLYIKFHVSFFI